MPATLLAATAVTAVGDVVVAGTTQFIPTATSPVGKVFVFDHQGLPKGELLSRGSQFSNPVFVPGSSDFYVSFNNYVDRIRADGTLVFESQPFGIGLSGLAVTASGLLYASSSEGPGIMRFDPSGAYLGTISNDHASESIDLAADQCTLFYVGNFRVGKMNVCTQQVFPPLVALPSLAGDIRILPDGSILVTTFGPMRRYSQTGILLATYGSNVVGVGLDLDPRFAWIISGVLKPSVTEFTLSRIDLASGNAVTGPVTIGSTQIGDFLPRGLAVYGEPRAALAVAIPLLGVRELALLAIALAALGLLAIRR